jgi:cell division protein FtsA
VGELFVAIDIGTSKVCTMIGKTNASSQIEIIGKGMYPCNCLKKGVIADIENTALSIRSSVNIAESAADYKVSSAYVNILGMHVDIINNKGWVEISNNNKEITKKDVERLFAQVSDINISDDKQLIDIIPRQYLIDGYDEILDPVGMVGSQLGMEAEIVAGKITSVQNIIKSMERANIKIDGMIGETFGTGEIVLTPEEKDTGVIMIDVGGSVTDVSVYQGKRLEFYGSIPIGGDYITNDIAIGLRVSNTDAEKLKCQYELALTTLIKNDQEVSIFDVSENKKRDVKVSEIVYIIEARVFEIFSLCRNLIEKAKLEKRPKLIVLTGGGISYVDGNKQIAEEVFGIPVRVAVASQFGITKPEFITAAGIIKYVADVRKGSGSTGISAVQKQNKIFKKDSFIMKIIRIFKDMF